MSVKEEDIQRFLIDDLNLNASAVGKDSMLFSTGVLDSFAMIELVSFLEKQAGIRIRPSELTLDNFDSIGRMLNFLADR